LGCQRKLVAEGQSGQGPVIDGLTRCQVLAERASRSPFAPMKFTEGSRFQNCVRTQLPKHASNDATRRS
jgi:hypothetical protein